MYGATADEKVNELLQVALFGPTVPAFGFGPLAPRSESLGVDGLACRPCHPHGPRECPLGHHACMRTLEPSRVAE